jgi:predicted dehydrogenase
MLQYTFLVELMGERATLRQDLLQWLDTPIDLAQLAAANPFPDVALTRAEDASGRPAIRIACTMPDTADVAHHPFQAEIDDLVACVLEGRDTVVDVFDAQKTMEVCLAADRSAERGGTPVSLPLIAD